MSSASWAVDTALRAIASTPTPAPNFDTDSVSPGIIGFLITFGVALAAVLLMVDMVRRVRRTRYREDIRAQLEEERRVADGSGAAGAGNGDPNGDGAGSDDPGRLPGPAVS